MDINYELYKVFYHVASTLSFSEASKQLFISQSAVSQSIKVLEKKLNQTLFIRSTKKVQLTPEGEILLKHVEPAMNLIRQGENQLLDSNSLNGGQLRIGASDTICRYYLVPFLSEFHKRYPNIHIKVTNRTSIECARLLDNGQVDLVQEANMALFLFASEYENGDFDAQMEKKVRAAIEDALQIQNRETKIEEEMAARVNVLKDISASMARELGREATLAELAERMKMSEDEIRDIMKLTMDAMKVSGQAAEMAQKEIDEQE